jgi:hypothetical protein
MDDLSWWRDKAEQYRCLAETESVPAMAAVLMKLAAAFSKAIAETVTLEAKQPAERVQMDNTRYDVMRSNPVA